MSCVAHVAYVGLLLSLTACSEDPSLRIRVDLERPPIHQLTISVYESPSLTCEQVEFADLTEAQLGALLVDEQTITGDTVEGTLDNLSRTGRKLIVVRGYAETGELLEGGCAEHDLVVANDSVAVKTHVIASVSAQPVVDEETGLPVDPLRIGVIVTDRGGMPLPNRPVAWRMIGPAGSDATQTMNVTTTADGTWQPELPACTNVKGTTPVFPVTPNLVGGFATSVRVAWANQVATQFSGVTNTDLALTEIDIPAETKHPCAVSVTLSGSTIQKRLVCVDGSFARAYPVTVANGIATLGAPASQTLVRPPVGLFALPVESDASQREVYAVDVDGNVTALFGAAPSTATVNCIGCTDNIVDAVVAPACGLRDTEKLMLVVRDGPRDAVRVMPSRGGLAVEIRGIIDIVAATLEYALRNSGCVTQIGPAGYEDRQLTVIDIFDPTTEVSLTRGIYACSVTTCKRVSLPVPGGAIGFTNDPPYLIGTSVDATGIVLATWGLITNPDETSSMTDLLIERAPRVASSMLPNRIAIGTFDEDDGTDMIWDFPRSRGIALELAYSNATGVRFQALSNPLGLTMIDMIATDATNDDHDDIIIVGRKVVPPNRGVVVVVPTHAVGSPKSIPVTTCGS
ncbi:MAG: hypothetical protein ACKV2T_27465 [Kofleriaceae bacterium]